MGFPELCDQVGLDCNLAPVHKSDQSDVLVALTSVEDMRLVDRLVDAFYHRLDQRRQGAHLVVPLSEALSELGANVMQHSHSSGVVAAQVYSNGDLCLAIGDAGIGFRKSFAGSRYNPAGDVEALDLALLQDVSSLPERGRGVGLPHTVSETLALRGTAWIRSGSALRVLDSQRAFDLQVSPIPGTMIGLEVPSG
jgi:hypothetical protein